ncbi:hypothetical protein BJ165DRAFT_1405766 [Panaeolus papilionaceus]|nr:hypothetical protein BJ165DRAFT_1405766 [Panaeolus papilionaceus]
MKLEIPVLSEPLDASSINSWLDHCEDAFKLFNSISRKPLSVANQILAAGLKMEDPEASQWWSQNRTTLKKLADWNSFTEQVHTRLRVCANPTLNYTTIKLDNLISLMSTTWNAMVAEGIHTSSSGNFKSRSNMNAPAAASSSSQLLTCAFLLPPLTAEEKEVLKKLGGCYHCQKTPSSPGWIQHAAHNCPACRATKPVVGVMEGGCAVAHVMAVNAVDVEWSGSEHSDASSVIHWAAALKAGFPFESAVVSTESELERTSRSSSPSIQEMVEFLSD